MNRRVAIKVFKTRLNYTDIQLVNSWTRLSKINKKNDQEKRREELKQEVLEKAMLKFIDSKDNILPVFKAFTKTVLSTAKALDIFGGICEDCRV